MDAFTRDQFHSNLPKEWIRKRDQCTNIIKKPKKFEIFTDKSNKGGTKLNWNNLPFHLSSYCFMFFNIFLILSCSFILIQLFLSISNDIRIRIDDEFLNMQYLIQDSQYKYEINRCDVLDIPAIKKDCMKWKKNMCKTRNDIQIMGIVMDCVGEMIDRFLVQISWKFFITLLSITIVYMIFYKKNRC